jgi:lipopolysaccharide/colanic/teichoic acid biosynthesis glycosyltransferase
MAVIAWAVRQSMGSPVLFRQVRPGYLGRPFRMYKFRTMRDARRPDGRPLPDVERLTAFGKFLRSTSLDELPELWNVLKGDMSLVGPRPLLPDYLPLYSHEQARRHDVKPGITGWAQVNGRNAIGWEEKLALDVWYVDHRSLPLDLRILFLTLKKVFLREGIDQGEGVTMERFRGTEAGALVDEENDVEIASLP